MQFLLGYRTLLKSCSCIVTVKHVPLTLNLGKTRSDALDKNDGKLNGGQFLYLTFGQGKSEESNHSAAVQIYTEKYAGSS